MSKRTLVSSMTRPLIFIVDPTECPFREFRDNELQPEFWGMGPAAFRANSNVAKGAAPPKQPQDYIWADDQTQPLPKSVRRYLNGWVRAEDLALDRWDAEVAIFEENNGNRMNVADIQLSHAQVLMRSSFCREVLSACFMLERSETVYMEHQWENFSFAFGPEGWRAKYHIYNPGLKSGGGAQHRPTLSKNGCYLVRLYYLGAWRCVWVSDQVPVDATESPLLPFSPLLSKTPVKPVGKQAPAATATASVVYLWPLLICKALLKLAAPDMNSDEDTDIVDDERMREFDILHALTGGMNLNYHTKDETWLWHLMSTEVPMFTWDDDDETQASTVKSKTAKKPTAKESSGIRRSLMYLILKDTKDFPPYHLPGITPGFEMSLLVTMVRDLPLKKPLPEPDVALWKYYRWVDWARHHGLYEAYECPRTKFLKVNGLMKLSYAPHLLDVQSTESITVGFIKAEQAPGKGKPNKQEVKPSQSRTNQGFQFKEELREWMAYKSICEVCKTSYVLYYPSVFECTSAASSPPVRITKVPPPRHLDMPAPKSGPLYLQIDGPEVNTLRMSLSVLHPRILANAGVLIVDYIQSAYVLLECFEWFIDNDLPIPKAFVRTCGYDAVEVHFPPGRHFCRIWVHSRMNWHLMLLSESQLLLGPRDQIQCAAARECPWVSRFLSNLAFSFNNWIKVDRSNQYSSNVQVADREFFRSYRPDLPWNDEVIGYDRSLLHWMFRQALQSHLLKKLQPPDLRNTCMVMRKYFCDPDFGLPMKPPPPISLSAIAAADPCDCVMPEAEETEEIEEQNVETEQHEGQAEEVPLVSPAIMAKLLRPPVPPATSNVCEAATEELPCGLLKEERAKVIKRHHAATTIQSYWRGLWSRKCILSNITVSPEVLKALQDTTFGNQESLSCLMNEFFTMYPGAKYAYSVASGLSGIYGLHQHQGTSSVTSKCKWIPFFQGVFYCHTPVKVHLDVCSSLHYSTVAVYDNDTGEQLPQAYNAHKTFDVSPNLHGYTVMGHGSLNEAPGIYLDAHWQLTVFTSTEGAFHVCDNDETEVCKELPLPHAYKLHIDEIFLPNRRNILGGIQLAVSKHEAVSFRAAATSPDLEIVAKLRTITSHGRIEELSSCSGKGEIFWPYIRLEPSPLSETSSQFVGGSTLHFNSARSVNKTKSSKQPVSGKVTKSGLKIKTVQMNEPKQYCIEVTAPSGWPLTVGQWKRVDEVRNSLEPTSTLDPAGKKGVVKDKSILIKAGSAKDKPEVKQAVVTTTQILPEADDAFVELECSTAVGGGITARRDDDRDVEFTNARKSWDELDYGRNNRGAEIRKEFREEFLETPPPPPSESIHSTIYDMTMNEGGEHEQLEEEAKKEEPQFQGPTPVSESVLVEMSVEDEEEAKFLTMPEILRDKFIPLNYVQDCTREITVDECVLITADIEEAAKKDRQARLDAALERMRELQTYNEIYVLGRQRERCQLLEELCVDSQWPPELVRVLEERDECIVLETLLRTMSATKKKQETKPAKK